MKIFNCRINNKALNNKWQPWILLLVIAAVTIFISLHEPTRKWLWDVINDNMLLCFTICIILFVKFSICRMLYVAKINEGDKDAQGCAGSSCLLTVFLGVCIIVLTIKCCSKNHKPQFDTEPKPIAVNIDDRHADGRTADNNKGQTAQQKLQSFY